jgi:hypothetical protein
MSDVSQGSGWWQASDLKWYPPELHADYVAPLPPVTPTLPPPPKLPPPPGQPPVPPPRPADRPPPETATPPPPSGQRPRRQALIAAIVVVIGVILVAAGITGYLLRQPSTTSQPSTISPGTTTAPTTTTSTAGQTAPPAKASLEGATVTIAVYCCTAPPGPAEQSSNTVSGTVPVSFPQGSLTGSKGNENTIPVSLDVTAGQVTLTAVEDAQVDVGSFNGYVYTFSAAPAITNVTVDPLTDPTLVPTSISFTSNSISVNVSGLHYPSGAKQILDITTAA